MTSSVPPAALKCRATRWLALNAAPMKRRAGLDDTIYDGTDIEDPDEFDYDDWKRREGDGRGPRRTRKQWFWWVIGLLILGALLWVFVVQRWCAIP